MASLVKVEAAQFTKYSWSSRIIKYHRAQIRRAAGFRESTRQDEESLPAWLAGEVCGVELVEDRLVEALLVHCRAQRIEPPGRIWTHINPYGRFRLDMDTRLDLTPSRTGRSTSTGATAGVRRP